MIGGNKNLWIIPYQYTQMVEPCYVLVVCLFVSYFHRYESKSYKLTFDNSDLNEMVVIYLIF